ncbi:hypothetical protein GGP68_002935 [Salinibacter ruber]|nr:hypothetical protein [Salinibacter ruber]
MVTDCSCSAAPLLTPLAEMPVLAYLISTCSSTELSATVPVNESPFQSPGDGSDGPEVMVMGALSVPFASITPLTVIA